MCTQIKKRHAAQRAFYRMKLNGNLSEPLSLRPTLHHVNTQWTRMRESSLSIHIQMHLKHDTDRSNFAISLVTRGSEGIKIYRKSSIVQRIFNWKFVPTDNGFGDGVMLSRKGKKFTGNMKKSQLERPAFAADIMPKLLVKLDGEEAQTFSPFYRCEKSLKIGFWTSSFPPPSRASTRSNLFYSAEGIYAGICKPRQVKTRHEKFNYPFHPQWCFFIRLHSRFTRKIE